MVDFSYAVSDRQGGGGYSTISIFARVLKQMGYHVHEQRSVHSNIKGMRCSYYNRSGDERSDAVADWIDLHFAFDQESLREDIGLIREGGILIADTSKTSPTQKGQPVKLEEFKDTIASRKIQVLAMPMAEDARRVGGNPIMRNTMALGMAAFALGIDRNTFYQFIQKQYGSKKNGAAIVESNTKAFDHGYDTAAEIQSDMLSKEKRRITISALGGPDRVVMLGNELVAFGAIVGGCRGFSSYPITPSSETFETMMEHMHRFGGVAVQAPSELAAVGIVIGLNYAGVRAMDATSGPGFSLKAEALSGGGSNEVPLVIELAQRSGPGTGLPTRTAQEDIRMAVYAGHGEFPRIVLTPGTPEEHFTFAAQAMNLAEKYQMLVIILTEQCMAQGRFTIDKLDFDQVTIDRGKTLLTEEDVARIVEEGKKYERYAITLDGVSPRALPGVSGVPFYTNSNEHTPMGFSTEDIEHRLSQVRKRARKIETLIKSGELPEPEIVGSAGAKIGFVGCGGVSAPIKEAIKELVGEGIETKFLRLRTLAPFPSGEVRKFVRSCSRVFIVEQNHDAQLREIIQAQVTGPMPRKLRSTLRYDGRPFRPRDIVEAFKRGGEYQ